MPMRIPMSAAPRERNSVTRASNFQCDENDRGEHDEDGHRVVY